MGKKTIKEERRKQDHQRTKHQTPSKGRTP